MDLDKKPPPHESILKRIIKAGGQPLPGMVPSNSSSEDDKLTEQVTKDGMMYSSWHMFSPKSFVYLTQKKAKKPKKSQIGLKAFMCLMLQLTLETPSKNAKK